MKGIENYSLEWPKKYELESQKIKAVLGDDVKDIQHIGSTSIPGVIGKPLIDIGVLVDSINDIDSFVKKLEPLGYSYKPDMSSAERIFFRKGDPVEYHLSIACPKHMFWKRQMSFRDYLRKHPELVEEYNQLKLRNIGIVPEEDFSDLSKSKVYNQGKDEFVEKVLKLAEIQRTTPIASTGVSTRLEGSELSNEEVEQIMDNTERAKETIKKIPYITIATVSEDGQPWNAPVFTAYDEKYHFYWGTYRNSQKSRNIRHNKNIFLVVFDSNDSPGEGFGVYIKAIAEELTDPKEIELAHKLLRDRHVVPYWKLDQVQGDTPIRLYKAIPEKVWVNGESQKDGHDIDTRIEIKL